MLLINQFLKKLAFISPLTFSLQLQNLQPFIFEFSDCLNDSRKALPLNMLISILLFK